MLAADWVVVLSPGDYAILKFSTTFETQPLQPLKLKLERNVDMTIIRKLIVALTMVTGLFAAGAAVADTNVSTGLTGKGTALAVHGYDVVAYFTQGQSIRGRGQVFRRL